MLLQSPIISTYPDLERQTKRDACLDELALTIEHSRGDQPASDFRSHLSVIGKIEAGYAVLSRSLDAALGIGDATHWLWASLHLAAEQVDRALKELDLQIERCPVIDASTFTLPRNDGGDRYAADELIAMIDSATSTILRMHAARCGCSGEKGTIVIPGSPDTATGLRLAEWVRGHF